MTTRTDFEVEYNSSPRVVEVAAPSAEVVMQDYVDTLRKHEDSFQGMGFPKLLNASGKEDLGGGTSVGITAASQNTLLSFEARRTPAETGTVTGAPASPVAGRQIIQDTTALFQTNNVVRGSLVVNFTDQSIADVVSVDSETQLTTKTLVNGIGNTYTVTDVYHVFNIVQVSATGGNLTAVDESQVTISPILPTAFTQVILTSSSSATIAGLEIAHLQRLIESLRPHHTGTGDIYYWDPFAGDDINPGNHPTKATKTFAAAHDLVTDNNHDIIICVPGDPTGNTVTTENLTISKNYVFVRGPGRDFRIQSADDNLDAINITGNGVEVSSMTVATSATSTKDTIHAQGDFALLKDLWISDAVNGMHVTNSEYATIENVKCHHNLGYGVIIDGTSDHVDLIDCHLGSNTLDNVYIDLDVTTHEVNFIGDSVIHSSVTGYGVNITANTTGVIIGDQVGIFNNFAGDLNDLGTGTYDKRAVLEASIFIDGVVIDAANPNSVSSSTGLAGTNATPCINDVYGDLVSRSRNITKFSMIGTNTLTATHAPGRVFTGTNPLDSITILGGADVTKGIFIKQLVAGVGSGDMSFQESFLNNMSGVTGIVLDSAIVTGLTLGNVGNSGVTQFSNVSSVSPGVTINAAAAGSIWNGNDLKGIFTLTNKGGAETFNLYFEAGNLTIDSTCTAGIINVSGNCYLTDNSGAGCTVNDLTIYSGVPNAVWSEQIEGTYTAEQVLRIMSAVLAGKSSKVGGVRTFRDIDDLTDRAVASVTDSGDRTAITLDGT